MDYPFNTENMKNAMCFVILIFLFVKCNDIIIPQEEELKRYPWIEIFTSGRIDFKGIEHNIDLGTYSFSFKTSYSSIDTFFMTTDSCALRNRWEIVQKSNGSRKYTIRSSVYKASEGIDFVNLTFNSIDGRITFISSVNK